ncbi:acyltransferase [Listeria sp. ILCC797]|uniref:acyltransferase n=1 Tax=Listeria sp. ILCC797 TaxID=1918333 RepID=UPI000B597663|nr:acyltransferase [Listeria sp. ILCC797]
MIKGNVEEQSNNVFLNQEKVQFQNSEVVFNGKDNLLILDENVTLRNSKIIFHGDHSVVYIKKTLQNQIMINLNIHAGSTVFIDEGASFNGVLNAIISEHQNLIVGKDAMFSFGSWIRTSDVHPIYQIESGERLNRPASVLIGDHVWIGQDVKLLKGATIGSSSIVGANAIVTSVVPNNAVVAGNPARVVKESVFWERPSMHLVHPSENVTKEVETNKFIFSGPSTQSVWKDLSQALSNKRNSFEKKTLIDSIDSNSKLCCYVEKKNKGVFGKFKK